MSRSDAMSCSRAPAIAGAEKQRLQPACNTQGVDSSAFSALLQALQALHAQARICAPGRMRRQAQAGVRLHVRATRYFLFYEEKQRLTKTLRLQVAAATRCN